MNILLKMLRALGRGLFGLGVFVALAIGWTTVMFFVNPWSSADPGRWPGVRPIIVGSRDTGKTRVILYSRFAAEQQADPTLVPWPLVPDGTGLEGRARTAWQTVDAKAWQYQASWDDGDYILESRYRLDGQQPVLVEIRGRDPSLGFWGMVLALLSVLVWKALRWWRRRARRDGVEHQ